MKHNDHKTVPAVWHVGDVILDLYEVKEVFTGGGMGLVYRVQHRGWNMNLAVKSPRPEFFKHATHVGNFQREAETWVNLGLHPHTVSCYYVRRLGGIPRIFTEFVDGGSLADWIRSRRLYEGGPDSAMERILDIAIQFAWGLQYAHEQGLIHQDVKPGNVLVHTDGAVKVTDFGLAKARAVVGETTMATVGDSILVTSGGMTSAYCSPEQANGKPLSRKTDIWSWAISALEMFLGEPPCLYGGHTAAEVFEYGLTIQDELDPELPRMPDRLIALLRQCFQREPVDRPVGMDVVGLELQMTYRDVVGVDYWRPQPEPVDLKGDALNNKALSLLDLEQPEEALSAFEQALAAEPYHLEATYNRGVWLWQHGAITAASLLASLREAAANESAGNGTGEVARMPGDAGYAVVTVEQLDRRVSSHGRSPASPDNNASRLIHRARIFDGHKHAVDSVAITPNGQWVLSVGFDGLRMWEAATGQCVQILEDRHMSLAVVAIAPSGKWALAGGCQSLRIWDLATGQCARSLEGVRGTVKSVAISSCGRWALSAEYKAFQIWEIETGRCVGTFEGESMTVCSMAMSPDGRWALAGGSSVGWDYKLRLWDLEKGECVRTLGGHKDYVWSVAISPDSRWALSGSWDTQLRTWELATGRCLHTFTGHTGRVTSVAISPDGRRALSGSYDTTMRVWNVSTGQCTGVIECHVAIVESVAFSPDGKHALSGSRDGKILMCELGGEHGSSWIVSRPATTAGQRTLAKRFKTEMQRAADLCAQEDWECAMEAVREAQNTRGFRQHHEARAMAAKIAANGRNASFRGALHVRTLAGHSGAVRSVAISPNARWALSGSDDKTLRMWELDTGRCIRVLEGHEWEALSVAISPDGRWALSGGGDKTLRIWDVDKGCCVRVLEGHEGTVQSVAISPDGRWAVSGGADKTVRMWNIATGKCVHILEGHSDAPRGVRSVAISPDGRWALSVGGYQTPRMWDLADGECWGTLEGSPSEARAIVISPDGRWALAGHHLWEALDIRRHLELNPVPEIRLSPISRNADTLGRMFNFQAAHCYRSIGDRECAPLAIFPDARWVLSGSNLWELDWECEYESKSGRCVRTLEGHTDTVESVAISRDARWVLSGSRDQTLRLWELDWECEFPEKVDWNEGARPYLQTFLYLHCPLASDEISRAGTPVWSHDDFNELLIELQNRGYGWLRPEGIRRELETMVADWNSDHYGDT